MPLTLPAQFRKIITDNTALSGALDSVISRFSDWITPNKTEFFPEYTDHGIEHVQCVLDTASDIITEASWQHITPEDIYVLTSSILLHDCAMHLNRESLWDLVQNDLYNGALLGFDNEEEWSKRWHSFCDEASRYDDSDYFMFFGEFRDVTLPEIGSNSLDDNQKIIIGDFVRRYHACMAQVISTFGIPSKGEPFLLFNTDFQSLNELSGFIARSHNHSLRSVVDLLGSDRNRMHRNTHPTFIMGILRIADYLQLKSDRTPKILFKTMAFCSPISIQEWKKHLAIISTNDYHPDEELIFIEAFPEDAKTLVGVRVLLAGLQRELDELWSVCGEVYSRYQPLNVLGIKYRRVKSNIDNPEKYVEENHKSYHPEVMSVKTDNQKLFPLLIKPLYGDNPQIGVRELLQNALDATNERFTFETGKSAHDNDVPHEITIEINQHNNTFTITDSGMGMNTEIIRDYFLKVGASFRTSEQWKSDFIKGESSKVPRTGKFGVGMLAGFLIGDSIRVETKHKDSKKSIAFDYTLDSNDIELTYTDKKSPGTVITIESDAERLTTLVESLEMFPYLKFTERLSSWWYVFDTPKVIYKVIDSDNTTETIAPTYQIKKQELTSGDWIEIEDSELNGFFWRASTTNNHVYCNGVVIQGLEPPKIDISYDLGRLGLNNIEICILDHSGRFPFNLTRDDLTISAFYEYEKLAASVKAVCISSFQPQVSAYQYDKKSIHAFLEQFKESKYDLNFFPVLFSENKIFPFAGTLHKSEGGLVFVDIIKQDEKIGLIHSPEFESIKSNFIYSFITGWESSLLIKYWNVKDIRIMVASFASNINHYDEHTHDFDVGFNSNYERLIYETTQKLMAWIYIKQIKFNRLQDGLTPFLNKYDLSFTKTNDWVVISKKEYINSLPDLGQEIIDTGADMSMFALYQPIELQETEFSRLWEEHIS